MYVSGKARTHSCYICCMYWFFFVRFNSANICFSRQMINESSLSFWLHRCFEGVRNKVDLLCGVFSVNLGNFALSFRMFYLSQTRGNTALL